MSHAYRAAGEMAARIAATLTCAHCGRPLPATGGVDYCGEDCQRQWLAAHHPTDPLLPDAAVAHESWTTASRFDGHAPPDPGILIAMIILMGAEGVAGKVLGVRHLVRRPRR